MINRFSKSAFWRPPSIKSIVQRLGCDAGFFAPFDNTHGFSGECHQALVSAISCLCSSRVPTAILLVVALVIIFPLDAMFAGRSWPHILNERIQRLSPTLADVNSTLPISGVCGIAGVMASANHATPRVVFECFAFPVNGICGNDLFAIEAAAATTVAATKGNSQHNKFRTAVARTLPSRNAMPVVAGISPYCQSSKNLPRQVFHAGRDYDRIGFSHDDAPNIRLVRDAAEVTASVAFRRLYQNQLAV